MIFLCVSTGAERKREYGPTDMVGQPAEDERQDYHTCRRGRVGRKTQEEDIRVINKRSHYYTQTQTQSLNPVLDWAAPAMTKSCIQFL